MRTYNRICLQDYVIEDEDKRLELKRGMEYITSEQERDTVVVFTGGYWAYGVPVTLFAGAQIFTR